jgi:ribosomal-protein-alanine N-acetyltransferase
VHAQARPPASLRDYLPADFDALWKIDQECFAHGISYSRHELEFYIRRPRAFTLVAEIEDAIVGFLVADRDRRGHGHIITLDVLPGARRTGLGRRLIAAAEDRLRAAGCRLVYLETAVDNAAALAFYKRLGYSVVSIIPRYYLNSVDALVMLKRLEVSTP